MECTVLKSKKPESRESVFRLEKWCGLCLNQAERKSDGERLPDLDFFAYIVAVQHGKAQVGIQYIIYLADNFIIKGEIRSVHVLICVGKGLQ